MDLRRQIATIRTWFPVLVLTTVLAGGIVYVATNLQSKVYEAHATLIVGQSLSGVNPDYTQLLASQRLSATYARIATMPAVLSGAIADLHLSVSPDEVSRRVSADAPVDTTLLTISAQADTADGAAALANAVANQLVAASPAVQGREADIQRAVVQSLADIETQIAVTQKQVDTYTALPVRSPAQDTILVTLQGQIISLRTAYSTMLTFVSTNASNALGVIQPAVPPSSPIGPRALLNAQLAALLGLLVALAIAFGVDFVRDAVKDAQDVRENLDLPTLGSVAGSKAGRRLLDVDLIVLSAPQSRAAEDYRTLRANIEFSAVDAPLANLVITSAASSEGKTLTSANLGIVFAQAGRRVLVVDADLRAPGLHLAFGLPNTVGLTTLLRSDAMVLEAVTQTSMQANLRILTSGPLPPNPVELLGSQRMRVILERLQAEYDLIIFDSPPLQIGSDAAVLSSFLDATVFVVDAGRTRQRAAREALDALAKAGANVLGVVINGVRDRPQPTDVGVTAADVLADVRTVQREQAPASQAR